MTYHSQFTFAICLPHHPPLYAGICQEWTWPAFSTDADAFTSQVCSCLTLLSNLNSDCKKYLVANRAGVVNPQREGSGGRDMEQGLFEERDVTAVAGDQCRQGALQWQIRNIPQRLQAVIGADGRQITKEIGISVSVTIIWFIFNELCCFCNKFISSWNLLGHPLIIMHDFAWTLTSPWTEISYSSLRLMSEYAFLRYISGSPSSYHAHRRKCCSLRPKTNDWNGRVFLFEN